MRDPFEEMRRLMEAMTQPFLEVQKILKRDQELLNSIGRSTSALKALEAQRSLGSVMARLQSEASDFARRLAQPMAEITRATDAARAAQQGLAGNQILETSWLETSASAQFQEISKGLAALYTPSAAETVLRLSRLEVLATEPLARVTQNLAAELVRASNFDAASSAFARDVMNQFSRIAEARSESEADHSLEEVVSWFAAEAAKRKPSESNFMGLLGILISFLILFYQSYESRESEDRLSSRIADAERALRQEIQAVAPKAQQSHLVVAARRLHLRSGPNASTKSIRVLLPNAPLEVLSEQDSWLKVRSFNYATGEVETGWVSVRYVSTFIINE